MKLYLLVYELIFVVDQIRMKEKILNMHQGRILDLVDKSIRNFTGIMNFDSIEQLINVQ